MSKQSTASIQKVFAFMFTKSGKRVFVNVIFQYPDKIPKNYAIPDSELKADGILSLERVERFFKFMEDAGLIEPVAVLIFENFDDAVLTVWERFLLSNHTEKLNDVRVCIADEEISSLPLKAKWNSRFSQEVRQSQIIPLLLPFWKEYFPTDIARIQRLETLKGYCYGLAFWVNRDLYKLYDCLIKLKAKDLPDPADAKAVKEFTEPLNKLLELQSAHDLPYPPRFGLGVYKPKGLQALCDQFLKEDNSIILNSFFMKDNKIKGHAIFLKRLPNGGIELRDSNLDRLRLVSPSDGIEAEIIKQLGCYNPEYFIECRFLNPSYVDSIKESKFLHKHAAASPLLFLHLVQTGNTRKDFYLQTFPSSIQTLSAALLRLRQDGAYYDVAKFLAYAHDDEEKVNAFCTASFNETDMPVLTFISDRRQFREVSAQRMTGIICSVLKAAAGKFEPAMVKGIGFLGEVSPLVRLILTGSQELSHFTDAIKFLLSAGFDINAQFEFKSFDASEEKGYQGTLAHWFIRKDQTKLAEGLISYGLDYKLTDSKGCKPDHYRKPAEPAIISRYAMVYQHPERIQSTQTQNKPPALTLGS
jgi:hypothetical protein